MQAKTCDALDGGRQIHWLEHLLCSGLHIHLVKLPFRAFAAGIAEDSIDLSSVFRKRKSNQLASRQFANRLAIGRDHRDTFRRCIGDPLSTGRPLGPGKVAHGRSGIAKQHRSCPRNRLQLHQLPLAAYAALNRDPFAIQGPSLAAIHINAVYKIDLAPAGSVRYRNTRRLATAPGNGPEASKRYK